MRPVYRGPVPTRATGRGVQRLLAEEYGFFRKALVRRIGEYCSYCEVPLGASLAVEHIVSKGDAAPLEVDWRNFLLACTNCNSSKGTQVTFNNIGQYYFPADTGVDTFDRFVYTLQAPDDVVCVSPAEPADQRAIRTIELVQLNRQRPDDPKAADRRVANRTRTWQVAVDLRERLATYFARRGRDANNDLATNLLKQQIVSAALTHGFWSVWMTVFGAGTFFDEATRDALLCELFVQPFPGTNHRIGPGCPNLVPADYPGGLPAL